MARGRPPGSRNKPRAPTASGSQPIDHNQSKAQDEGLTVEQQQKLFHQFVAKGRPIAAQIASLGGELRAIYSQAKAELGDDGKTQVKFAIEVRDPQDAKKISDKKMAKAEARWRNEATAAKWLGAPMGTQWHFFEDRTPSVEKAFEAGKRDGLAGADMSKDWIPGTPQYERYRDGYAEGQKVNIAGIRQKDGEEFDQAQSERYDATLADSDTSDPLGDGTETSLRTEAGDDPFGEVGNTDALDPEASTNAVANVTPISNGRSKRSRGGKPEAEPVTAA